MKKNTTGELQAPGLSSGSGGWCSPEQQQIQNHFIPSLLHLLFKSCTPSHPTCRLRDLPPPIPSLAQHPKDQVCSKEDPKGIRTSRTRFPHPRGTLTFSLVEHIWAYILSPFSR